MHDRRRSAVAGSWYPASADALQRAVEAHLAAARRGATSNVSGVRVEGTCPRALIAPHAGLMYSGPVAAYAYQLVAQCRYAAAVLVGPSHFVPFDGVSIWPRGMWETPFGPVAVDEALAAAIAEGSGEVHEYQAAHAREHSLEMQMPFVGHLLPGVPIVPLLMGYQTRETAEALGRALGDAIAQRTDNPVLLIASSDLSHYHEAAVAEKMDGVIVQHVDAFDPDGMMTTLEHEPGHACGGGPMVAVLHAARRCGATRAAVLRYGDSGDVSGDKTAVVGYMAAAVW